MPRVHEPTEVLTALQNRLFLSDRERRAVMRLNENLTNRVAAAEAAAASATEAYQALNKQYLLLQEENRILQSEAL